MLPVYATVAHGQSEQPSLVHCTVITRMGIVTGLQEVRYSRFDEFRFDGHYVVIPGRLNAAGLPC